MYLVLCLFSSDRLLVTWSMAPDLHPALCTRMALIKKGCKLTSVQFSMHLLHEEECQSAGYTNCKLEELELVTTEAVQVRCQFAIYHKLDSSSPLLKLWRSHQENPSGPYIAPLVIVKIVGIDVSTQAEVSETKVYDLYDTSWSHSPSPHALLDLINLWQPQNPKNIFKQGIRPLRPSLRPPLWTHDSTPVTVGKGPGSPVPRQSKHRCQAAWSYFLSV